VAFVLSGPTIANVVGVPAITWVGQNYGWRTSYMVVAAIFALTFGAVWALVPWQPGNAAATMRNELKAFGRLQVWLTLLIGSVGFGGLFAVYTYVAPLATERTGLSTGAVPGSSL
jgi:DHA1 family inner membrane transport protein